ncbi:unnamed protein product [Adineta steineri]|uniref:Apple domain-containing protein n=1 Tax=Adineta steineri TaxID=433720 RepID=A0A818NXL7_9BILA|nr:unnamed protein product [Adineta steineri]CAF3612390.1 unnamed protein product [Adineta steineri]
MKRGATYTNLPTSSRCTEFISGKDYGRGDISANYPAQVRSPAACAALCEEYPDCIAWTFNVKSAKCWVKSTLPALGSGTDTYTGSCKKSSK